MRITILAALSIMVAAFCSGCLEIKETFTVNPDGSGKVALSSVMRPFDFDDKKKTAKEKKEEIDAFVRQVVGESQGIEVWKDVTCKRLSDGRISFQGTAYFRDIGAIDIKQASTSKFVVRKAEGGEMVIEYGENKGEEIDTTVSTGVNLSEEEIAARIDSAKEQFQMGRAMLGMILEEWDSHTTIRFPGTIDAAPGFARNQDGSISIDFSGKRMMALIDSLTNDEGYWRREVMNDQVGKADRDRQMKILMFGTDTPQIKVSGAGAPLFDYTAEVTAARKKYPALLKKYKIEL